MSKAFEVHGTGVIKLGGIKIYGANQIGWNIVYQLRHCAKHAGAMQRIGLVGWQTHMAFDGNLFEYFEMAVDNGFGPAHCAQPAVDCVVWEVETNSIWRSSFCCTSLLKKLLKKDAGRTSNTESQCQF